MSIRFMGALSVAAFALATLGSDAAARMTVGRESLPHAVLQHLHDAAARPLGTLILFAPFSLLGLICAGVEDKTSRRRALTIFSVFAAALIYLYFRAFEGAEHALIEHRRTAAALSVGLLPFMALPVILLAALLGLAAAKVGG